MVYRKRKTLFRACTLKAKNAEKTKPTRTYRFKNKKNSSELQSPIQRRLFSLNSRLKMKEMNSLFTCFLCKGYLIDATTLAECLHSFCKSCLIKYFDDEDNPKYRFCPKCNTQIHKTRPKENIHSDSTFQDIIYKIVPDLYKKEMEQRKMFYDSYPNPVPGLSNEQRGELNSGRLILSLDDLIQISIEYYPDLPNPFIMIPYDESPDDSINPNIRYLMCKAGMSIITLKKFISLKYELDKSVDVQLLFKHELLKDDLRMMDIVYIYSCRLNSPIPLYYLILDTPKSKENFKKLFPEMPTIMPNYTFDVMKSKSKKNFRKGNTSSHQMRSRSSTLVETSKEIIDPLPSMDTDLDTNTSQSNSVVTPSITKTAESQNDLFRTQDGIGIRQLKDTILILPTAKKTINEIPIPINSNILKLYHNGMIDKNNKPEESNSLVKKNENNQNENKAIEMNAGGVFQNLSDKYGPKKGIPAANVLYFTSQNFAESHAEPIAKKTVLNNLSNNVHNEDNQTKLNGLLNNRNENNNLVKLNNLSADKNEDNNQPKLKVLLNGENEKNHQLNNISNNKINNLENARIQLKRPLINGENFQATFEKNKIIVKLNTTKQTELSTPTSTYVTSTQNNTNVSTTEKSSSETLKTNNFANETVNTFNTNSNNDNNNNDDDITVVSSLLSTILNSKLLSDENINKTSDNLQNNHSTMDTIN